jgi:hypothetical protein
MSYEHGSNPSLQPTGHAFGVPFPLRLRLLGAAELQR